MPDSAGELDQRLYDIIGKKLAEARGALNDPNERPSIATAEATELILDAMDNLYALLSTVFDHA